MTQKKVRVQLSVYEGDVRELKKKAIDAGMTLSNYVVMVGTNIDRTKVSKKIKQ